MIIASIFNSQRTDVNQKVFNPSDFIPMWDLEQEEVKSNTTHNNDDHQANIKLFKLLMS
jgi:hypothetical protein